LPSRSLSYAKVKKIKQCAVFSRYRLCFCGAHQAVISALGAKVTPGFDTKLKMVDFLLSTIFG
ncbi:MAG: hypothetical protein ACOCNU_06145, partial [Bacteroidales bacterium]